MINFKSTLDQITDKNELEKWRKMDNALFDLSDALKKESKILEGN